MRKSAVLPVLLLVLSGAAGCAGGTPSAGAPTSTGTAGECLDGRVTATEVDSGRQLCVVRGTSIDVYLHGSPDGPWSAVTADGPVLRPVASGRRTLPVGVTAGFFTADTAGPAHLTATRPCAGPTPSPAGCGPASTFSLDVRVR